MNAGKTRFSQLMDCLPWSTFTRIVARYHGAHDSPHISYRPEYVRDQRLLLQQGTEAFHQRAQPALRHGRDQVVQHAALTEQGMGPAFGGVGAGEREYRDTAS